MGRTQLDERSLRDGVITGASFAPELMFWSEVSNYVTLTRVYWQDKWFEANTNITGGVEGDLTNSPDINPDWTEVTNVMWSAYPSSVQTFNNTAVTLSYNTTRTSNAAVTLNTGEVTFNTNGNFIIHFEFSSINTTGTRMTSKAFLQKSTDGGTNWNTISNTEVWAYNREATYGHSTGSLSLPITVVEDDMYRVRIQSSNTTNISTVIAGCNIAIFALMGTKGDKGLQGIKGDTGASGDINWLGAWSAGTYSENDAVGYLGTSYVSTANNNTETPSDTATNWDILAKKGADGSGTQINIAEEGSNLTNTPHGTINFIGDLITAVDDGSGVATVTVAPTKQKYMVVVWAEENATLANNTYEWAFGNGASTSANNGITALVPSGYTCIVKGMSLNLNAGSAEVELEINGVSVSRSISGDAGASNKSPAVTFGTALAVNNGDRLNFKTISAAGTSSPNTVCVWLEYNES